MSARRPTDEEVRSAFERVLEKDDALFRRLAGTPSRCVRCGARPPADDYAIVDVVVEDAEGARTPVPLLCGSCWEIMIRLPHRWHIVEPTPGTGKSAAHYISGGDLAPHAGAVPAATPRARGGVRRERVRWKDIGPDQFVPTGPLMERRPGDPAGPRRVPLARPPARLLFVCSAATDRSPTAARTFLEKGFDTRARGTWPSARRRLRPEDLEWCDAALVMEQEHAAAIREAFPEWWSANAARVDVLGIADDYGAGDPQLVALLEQRVGEALRRRGLAGPGAAYL